MKLTDQELRDYKENCPSKTAADFLDTITDLQAQLVAATAERDGFSSDYQRLFGKYNTAMTELSASREMGPCGKHPKMFWIPIRPSSQSLVANMEHHCTLCTEIQAERAAVLETVRNVREILGKNITSCTVDFIIEKIEAAVSDTDRLALDRYVEEAEHKGWLDCLRNVQGSIEGYPNHGGDIEIMKGIERIVEEKVREGRLAEHDQLCQVCKYRRLQSARCPRGHELAELRAVPADKEPQ